MSATPEQRARFGERLRELRTATRRTQADIAKSLDEAGGENVSDAAFSEWERGVSAPSHQNALALERIFNEPDGALGGMLGYAGEDPSTDARLARLEDGLGAEVSGLRAEVAGMRAELREIGDLLRLLDRSPDAR